MSKLLAEKVEKNERFGQLLKILIKDILISNKCYYTLSVDQEEFELSVLYDVIIGLKPETFYKVLVLLDRSNPIGKFALYYNHIVHDAVVEKDVGKLKTIFKNPTYEGDKKEFLSAEAYNHFQKIFQMEMNSMNYLIDKTYRTLQIPKSILYSNTAQDCKMDICIKEDPERSDFVTKNAVMVWAMEVNNNNIYTKYCFTLPNLLNLILTRQVNPYTRMPFNAHTINNIKRNFPHQLELVEIYNKMVN